MSHYIAYHSTERMGYEYKPKGEFSHYSGKPLSFLQSAIGGRIWVIAGKRGKKRTEYSLAATYLATEVVPVDSEFLIRGESGLYFKPAPQVSEEAWFKELFREQNQFSYGFSQIRSDQVINALLRILKSTSAT